MDRFMAACIVIAPLCIMMHVFSLTSLPKDKAQAAIFSGVVLGAAILVAAIVMLVPE